MKINEYGHPITDDGKYIGRWAYDQFRVPPKNLTHVRHCGECECVEEREFHDGYVRDVQICKICGEEISSLPWKQIPETPEWIETRPVRHLIREKRELEKILNKNAEEIKKNLDQCSKEIENLLLKKNYLQNELYMCTDTKIQEIRKKLFECEKKLQASQYYVEPLSKYDK